MSDVLTMWTVYDHPSDYDGFIARRFEITSHSGAQPTTTIVTGETLDEVRAKLPPGLYCMARQPGDDPPIVESWI